ncbi:hypothetical protein Sste5346_001633 [Sporothrix stenoceras]|uniref:Arabinogalactan endo-beta-1,4-galactanase n=1 Tax=Sporothrix stenoceras TaxID=5173 RepID=A0ABR3ZMK2_9PEZI
MKIFTLFINLTGTVSIAYAALAYRGVDWSSVAVEEAASVVYKSATTNQPAPLESILAASGVNMVRQRLWVNPKPDNGAYNLDYNLKLARRARAAGLAVYLDLHYSDTWADPGHQSIPAGWPKTLDGLTTQLFNYTRDVCNAFADDAQASSSSSNGTTPPPLSIISIGNEITNGLLWPVGSTKSYGNIAALLHAASGGVKASKLANCCGGPPPKIMVHLDNGWSWSAQNTFYSKVLASGSPFLQSDFDMMGVSYYPFYNAGATLASLRSSLQNMAAAWGKELVVAETDWPTSCPQPKYSFPADARSIPFTVAGQTSWIKAVADVVSGVKGGSGLFYWEPAWIHNAGLGSSCADNLMVSQSGQALSSLAVFSTI